MLKKISKVLFVIFLLITTFFVLFSFVYVKVLPFIVSNNKIINFAEKTVSKYSDFDIKIINPELTTGFSPVIDFSVEKIIVNVQNDRLFEVENLDTSFSFSKLLKKTIIVYRFGADKVFADFNKLFKLSSKENNNQQNFDWKIDLFDSILYVNNFEIIYNPKPDTLVNLKANNVSIDNTKKIERFVHLNFDADITRNNRTVHVSFTDNNKIVIKNKHIYVDNCPLTINHSKMFFNAVADNEKNYEVIVFSKRFFIPDVIKLLLTDVVENNIKDVLAMLGRINGDVDFKVKLTNNSFDGEIILNRLSAKIVQLNNLPFTLNSGIISIKGQDLTLKNFKGFYNNKKENEFDFEGSVKDYLKTIDTNIVINALLTNDFFEDYLSKLAGVKFTLKGKSKSKIIVDFMNNNFDIKMMGKIAKGDDILVEGSSLSPVNFDRALTADIHLTGEKLNIETINYYIAKELNKNTRGVKPILNIKGNMNIITGKIYDLGFEIPNPLPSEFLNVLIGQKMFKRGKFWGDMYYVNKGEYPVLAGELFAEKIIIPSQRLFLKEGKIKTENGTVNITANGKYRRCGYEFSGKILNALVFPIVVKNTSLVIDDIDIDRIMKAMTAPVKAADYNIEDIEKDDSDSVNMTFDPKNLIIEECILKIKKGNYNEINFANIAAKMSLDRNSIFKLYSNRFEIAEGHSSADVRCDLKNKKYSLRLGIKDVNSDIMSTAILNLKREISGKASGLIALNTDDSLKLNGSIKFVVKNGTIQKIGLVEYILKFAALFRNPLAMISPTIFSDMVNIPEGNFDKITGDLELKNNVIELIRIKSYAPQLSAYIVGRYDLENSDAILRIYTKFTNKSKGFAGFLRNLSLNSLANRIPLNSRNDMNYYAAELAQLPDIDADEKDCQIFLTKVDGDVEHNNFISSLKKIK